MTTSPAPTRSRLLRLVGDDAIERIVLRGGIILVHLYLLASASRGSPPVQHQPSRDREQPRPQRALTAKAVDRGECTNERVLHHLFDVVPRPDARHEARHRVACRSTSSVAARCSPAFHLAIRSRSVRSSVREGDVCHAVQLVGRDAATDVKAGWYDRVEGAKMLARPASTPFSTISMLRSPLRIAHRGMPRRERENTLPSFAAALAAGARESSSTSTRRRTV